MRDMTIPDLTFPMVNYGRQETPWDLRFLLYKGGANGHQKMVFNHIAAGDLGSPLIVNGAQLPPQSGVDILMTPSGSGFGFIF